MTTSSSIHVKPHLRTDALGFRFINSIYPKVSDSLLQFLRQGNVLPVLATQCNVALDELPYDDLLTLKDLGIRAETASHVRRRSAIAHYRVHGRLQCEGQMRNEAGRTGEQAFGTEFPRAHRCEGSRLFAQ